MKKYFTLLFLLLFSIIFISCNKDSGVSPGEGNTGPVTQTFTSTPPTPIPIAPNSWTLDSLNANITDITSYTVSDVKLNLNTLEGVTVSNLRFVLAHNGTEVIVIDNLVNVSGSGNLTNLVLSDSASTSIMTVNNYPITGIYQPVNPLSGLDNLTASGYWTLKIYNSGTFRTGVIKSWGITLTYKTIQTPTSVILPLAVGNIWVTEERDTNNNILSIDTTKIVSTATYQNKTVYYTYRTQNPNDSIYVSNESDGLWVYNINYNQSGLMWKYPINPGEKYYTGMLYQDTVWCLSNNRTVTTPLGEMTGCVVYGIYEMGLQREIYIFKPNLGIIGQDYYVNGIFESRSRLIYYRLY